MSDHTPELSVAVEKIEIDQAHISDGFDPDSLLVLPTKNLVLFPEVTISIALKRESSELIATHAYEHKLPVGIVCQKNFEDETPTLMRGLYRYGVVADLLKIIEMPDGEKTALLHGRGVFKILMGGKKTGFPKGCLVASVQPIEQTYPAEDDSNFAMTMKKVREKVKKLLPAFVEGIGAMFNDLLQGESDELFINMLATNLPCENEDKVKMLAEHDIAKRALMLLKILIMKEHEADLSASILNKVRNDMTEEQRRNFLQHQIDVIHDELYGDLDDAQQLEARANETKFTEQAGVVFQKELNKLRRTNPQTPDYSILHTYLETLLDLPWSKESELVTDFSAAHQSLDKEHCGLEKVKERILEQIAVLMHNPEGKAPILCLVGPPGVGKTSLGVSIANALGRKYQRVSMGGLHDEAEIRGHRRTYIGAMPGRIIDAMTRAGTSNPVLLLDEVDKIGADYKGDPAAALLEVLDPEQNCRFHDNYVDVDFDLSHVLFIATANTLSTVAQPLVDRMEVIPLSGYLPEEKMEIARKHLLRRILAENKIEDGAFEISDEALNVIIDTYTSESGVRDLEKKLATIVRKYLFAKMSNGDFPKLIEPKHLKDLIGTAPYFKEKYEGNDFAGVVTGLAWTQVGGEIILAEASLIPGEGKETLTGNLGNVMKESASIAYQWVKAHAELLGIDPAMFGKYNLHIHFPEGAVPKDGPSAGITIATAIASAFTRKKVMPKLAMTGEMTLRGKVLPVGGIKEKILAAKRAGITDIILSFDNKKDIEDIDKKYIDGLNIHYVKSAVDVMNLALTEQKADNA